MNFRQSEKYLGSFVNYEKRPFFAYDELKIERVRLLFKCLGISCGKSNVIHIAGTKGKGSTAHMCAYLLASSGLKVGLYTSPHFFDFRERVRIVYSQMPINKKLRIFSKLISKRDLLDVVNEIEPIIKKNKFSETLGRPTFFEVYTAIALKYFLNKKLGFAVLETGLGGRLDATNAVIPQVSIITHVGYDHTDKLGEHLNNIAFEKAGIIKKNIPVVCSCQRSSVEKIIIRQSRINNAQLFMYGRNFQPLNIRIKNSFTFFDFQFQGEKIKNVKINLKGNHQIENACCALAAICLLRQLGIINQKVEVKNGLSEVRLEGRFEIVEKKPLVIIDIAHNCSSFLALQNSLDVYFPAKKVVLIFACSCDKDAKAMLKLIRYDRLIITQFNNPRAENPEDIKRKCKIKNALIAKNIKEALAIGRKIVDNSSLILISGSFFLVSEAKLLIKKVIRGKD